MYRRKITVVLELPQRSPGKTILYAKHIAACMQGNPYFPAPTLPLATLASHIQELEEAEVVAMTRAQGAATARDAKLVIVEDDLRLLRTYVETVANASAADGEAIVVSSGMAVKERSGPRKAPAAVKQGKTSGSLRIDVRRPRGAVSFFWQYSTDGVHWVDAPSTTYAHQDIANLTPGVRYQVRYRTLKGDVMSDWSDPLALLVV
jgi:hypothetical protein